MDVLKDEVKHYIRVLEDFHWNTACLYDARLRLGDIAKEFQPVKSTPLDKIKLENAEHDPTLFIYEKMEREAEAKRELDKAQANLDEAYKIMSYILDTTEKQIIEDMYTNSYFKNRRNKIAEKYSYDVNGLSQKIYRTIKKAVIRMKSV